MKLLFCILTIISATCAGYAPPTGPWTMGAWRPPKFYGDAIQANAGRLWIGKSPSAFCPTGVSGLNCTAYPGDSTVFAGGNDTIFLNVAVPGGQQVYVDPDGALCYTPPHSASKPDGSIVSGWLRETSDAGGAPTVLGHEGTIMACPAGEGEVYQIFIKPNLTDSENACTYISLRTYTASGTVAWEY